MDIAKRLLRYFLRILNCHICYKYSNCKHRQLSGTLWAEIINIEARDRHITRDEAMGIILKSDDHMKWTADYVDRKTTHCCLYELKKALT